MPDDVTKERENPHLPAPVPSPFAPVEPETIIRTQRRLRYTGDGSAFVAGLPADPANPEFETVISDADLAQAIATGQYTAVDAKAAPHKAKA